MLDLISDEAVVSVWLNCQFDEENSVIGWYDHDQSEGGGMEPRPVRDLLRRFGYAHSWLDAAVAAADKLGVTEASYAFLLFGYRWTARPGFARYKGRKGVNSSEGACFLGAFPFSRTPPSAEGAT